MTEPDLAAPLILVVDDDPQSLKLLGFALGEAGYRVAVANGGEMAFRVLLKRLPDLILCDVIMPDMDGYAVCRRLKASPATAHIPLMFLTSRTDPDDLIRGFDAGAVDYLTKPFNEAELLARVRTHTELTRARASLLESARHLESLNQRLRELDAEKNMFLGIVAHDLKNPLTTILMSAEMVEDRSDKIAPAAIVDYMQMITRNAERIRTLIGRVLDVNKLDSGRLELDLKPVDLGELVRLLAEQYQEGAQRKRIELALELPELPVQVLSDEDIVIQIVDNLLSNAIKYSPLGSRVCLRVARDASGAQLEVSDQGPGFSEADRSRMFQKFARLTAQPTGGESSTGLGLSIVRRLSEMLQGSISCISEPGKGAAFTLTLPERYEG